MVNGVCKIVLWMMMLSVAGWPVHLSFEHTGITFHSSGSYSVFLSTQDWRTHVLNSTKWDDSDIYTHAVGSTQFTVPWRDSIIIIINNKKHNLSQ